MRFGGAWSAIIVMQVAFSVLCLPFGISAVLEARRETGLRAAARRAVPHVPTGCRHRVPGRDRISLARAARGEADFMYTPVSADEASWMVLRVNGGADGYAQRLRTVAMQVDPSLRLHDVLSLREKIRRDDEGVISMVLIGIAVVLLIVALSAASLYALMSVA